MSFKEDGSKVERDLIGRREEEWNSRNTIHEKLKDEGVGQWKHYFNQIRKRMKKITFEDRS